MAIFGSGDSMKTQEQPQSFVDGNKYFLRVQILVSLGEPDTELAKFFLLEDRVSGHAAVLIKYRKENGWECYFLRGKERMTDAILKVAVEHFLELIGTQGCVGERKVQVDWIPKGLSPMGTLDWLKARTGAVEVSNKKEGGQL